MQDFFDYFIEICDKIDEYFPNPIKHLKVSTDPCDGNKELVLIIITKLDVKDVMERMDRFDKEWWDKQPDELVEKLIIMVG